MGVVFKAWQKGLNRDVALKMIKAGMLADFRQVRLFQIEAEAVAALDHPHIVPILDSGEHQGILYYSMKLIDGRNLADGLDRFRDRPMAIARLLVRISEAIHHAHERGVLHRDLKPSNILVDERDEPHVIDFGLAKRLGEGVVDESAATSHIMGTPSYMSPEQARGHRDEITTATDVYGLGTILYTLLSGRPPYTGGSALEVLRQIHEQEVPAPHVHNPRVDRDLETICLKCLGKQPRDRYASARDLADDLNRWIEGRPIVARPASKVERAVKWVRRRPDIAAWCALVAIVALLGLAGIIWNWRAAIAASEAAITASKAAITARDEAIRSEDYARHVAYAAKLNLAERDWHDASLSEARRHLDETRPPDGKSDLRGFEWYYLDRLCNSQEWVLSDHKEVVSCLAYSPDNRHLASGSWDHSAVLWDIATGQPIRRLADKSSFYAIAFAPDGKTLASGGFDVNVTLWDVATGQPIRRLAGHTKSVGLLAYSPDGKILASASMDGTVKLWDAAGTLLRTLDDQSGGLAFSRDGKILYSNRARTTEIRAWDTASGAVVRTFTHDDAMGPTYGMAIDAEGHLLATGLFDGTILLRETATGRVLRTFRDQRDPVPVNFLAFARDGKTLAAGCSSNQAVTLWDAATGHLVRTLKGNTATIQSIAFGPDGVHLACASNDRKVRIWDATKDQEFRSLREQGVVFNVAFGPDGSYLVSACLDRSVTLRDVADGQVVRTFKGHTSAVHCVAVRRDGRLVASAGHDRTVRIWDPATGRELHTLKGHEEDIWSLAFAPDGKTLASGSDDRSVKIWDIEAGREIRTLRGHIDGVNALAYTPDGKTLISAGSDGFVLDWDVDSGRRERAILAHPGGIRAMAMSPDGRRLATGGFDRLVKTWDLAAGRAVHTLQGHAAPVDALAFSADGRRLASGGRDRTVRVWDPAFGQEVLVLRGHAGTVWGVAFSPDGRRIASASDDHTIKLWETRGTPGAAAGPASR